MNISCTRRLQFCAGHRVMGHENKCAHPHGHNYIVHITADALALDSIGRVIDFSALKAHFGRFIEECWDHGFLIHKEDVALHEFLTQQGFKCFVMPYNPTAENIAHFLATEVAGTMDHALNVRVTRVVVEETENCNASYDV